MIDRRSVIATLFTFVGGMTGSHWPRRRQGAGLRGIAPQTVVQSFWCAVLALLLAAPTTGAQPQDPEEDRSLQSVLRALARRYDESDTLSSHRLEIYRGIRDRLRNDAALAGKDRNFSEALFQGGGLDLGSVLFAVRPFLTSGRPNPLITDDCRRQALERGFAHWIASGGAADDWEAVRSQWRSRLLGQDSPWGRYYSGLIECGEACLPLAIENLTCHVLQTGSLDHLLLLFDYNSRVLDSDDAKILDDSAIRLTEDADLRVLLLSRTEKPAEAGMMTQSLQLALERGQAVAAALIELGIDPQRIDIISVGWQEPHLDAGVVGFLGYQELAERLGVEAINRSVQIVFLQH